MSPQYGARTRMVEGNVRGATWAPRAQEDYGSGGAFPEINVVQFPEGVGWSAKSPTSAPVAMTMAYEELVARAARLAFGEARSTPEYEGFLKHLARCARDGELASDLDGIARGGVLAGAKTVRRVRGFDASLVESEFLRDEGEPVVFEDGMEGWPGKSWTLDTVKENLASFVVTCNDRAPARRTDAADGSGAQRTHAVPLGDFIEYVQNRDGDDDHGVRQSWNTTCVPFYANGMRVFSESEHADGLARAFPPPYFTSHCDNTQMLIRLTVDHACKAMNIDKNTPGLLNIDQSVSSSLNKMFCGPKGTITRLHYDSGDAHAWLGQVSGAKLFVFYPPSQSACLHPIETSHSPVDPLNPDYSKYPELRAATPRVALLRPGDVVLNPRRWWHYAVALEPSITVMRNFYNASTNAQYLVMLIANMAKDVSAARGADAARIRGPSPRGRT